MRTKREHRVNGGNDEPKPGTSVVLLLLVRAQRETKDRGQIWHLEFSTKILPNCGGYTIYSVYAAYPSQGFKTHLSKAAVSCPGSPRAGAFLYAPVFPQSKTIQERAASSAAPISVERVMQQLALSKSAQSCALPLRPDA